MRFKLGLTLRLAGPLALVAIAPSLFAGGITQLAPNADIIPNNAPTASTQFGGTFDSTQSVDNYISANNNAVDHGLIFQGSETFNGGQGFNQQYFAVSGFNSSIGEIWLYSLTNDTLRVPAFVTIKSSLTSQTSLNPNDYETTLLTSYSLHTAAFTHVPTVVDPVNDPAYATARYAVINLGNNIAPPGTKSLFFDFDADTTPGFLGGQGGNGARIQEVQAFAAAVPEPASLALLALASLAMAARRNRHWQ